MEPDVGKTRLAAILVSDVVGYSRLMEADEQGTVAQIKAHRREILDPRIATHRGKVLKRTGDGALIEFESVIDAVRCAVEIQRALGRHNADVPADRRIEYRVGIDIGDVIFSDDDFHGSGVNAAARLQTLAKPGGICVSRSVYNRVKSAINFSFVHLGERKVKNLSDPIDVYRIDLDAQIQGAGPPPRTRNLLRVFSSRWAAAAAIVAIVAGASGGYWAWDNWWRFQRVEAASVERMAYPLPDKPSIAVLPFDNLTGDPARDIFVDGLSEDIITALSKLPYLFVIARNSTFVYKGKAVSVKQVAEALGIRYVLEGSVQKAGGQLRYTAQLIDAVNGEHVWSGRYDRGASDTFSVRDEIVLNIVSEIDATFELGGIVPATSRETDSLAAWLLYREGRAKLSRISPEYVLPARVLFEKAIEIDPGYASAYANIGGTYRLQGQFWPGDKQPAEYFRKAREYFEQALALDDSHAYTFAAFSALHLARHEYDQAVDKAEKGVALDPNNPLNQGLLGWAYNLSVRPKKAIPRLKLAMRLSPIHPNWMLGELAHAYLLAGENEQAQEAYHQLFQREPSRSIEMLSRARLALILADLGREDEARAEITKAVELFPRLSTSYMIQSRGYKDNAVNERFKAVWRRLGMPEGE